MSGKYHGTKCTNRMLRDGYYPGWRAYCEPLTWTVDASQFQTSQTGAYAILCPTGRLVWETFDDCLAAPEMRGVIEAVRMCPTHQPSTVETDQLSVASIMHGGFAHAVRLSQTIPMWEELIALLRDRDVTLKWVKGHGKQSNARMAIVDEASRKAARIHFHDPTSP